MEYSYSLRKRRILRPVTTEEEQLQELVIECSQDLEFKRHRGDQVHPQDIVHVNFRDDTEISETSNEDDVIVEEFEEEEEEVTLAEQVAISSQIASLKSQDHDYYGLDTNAWTVATKHFKSRERYELTIHQFLCTIEKGSNLSNEDLAIRFSNYIYMEHDKMDRVPTVFRSLFSHMLKFFKLTGKGNLKYMIPGLYQSLNDFESGYLAKHSKEFTEEDMQNFLKLDLEEPEYIMQSAYAVSQISNASRANEGGIEQMFGNVNKLVITKKNNQINILK